MVVLLIMLTTVVPKTMQKMNLVGFCSMQRYTAKDNRVYRLPGTPFCPQGCPGAGRSFLGRSRGIWEKVLLGVDRRHIDLFLYLCSYIITFRDDHTTEYQLFAILDHKTKAHMTLALQIIPAITL